MSVAGFPFVFLLPETYSPKILEHRAEKLRKAGQTNARAMTEIHAKTTMQVVQGHVVRPLCESSAVHSICPSVVILRQPLVPFSDDRKGAYRPGRWSLDLARLWYHLVRFSHPSL